MPASVYVPSPLESLPSDSDNLRSLKAAPPVTTIEDDDSSLQTVDGLIRRRALLHPDAYAVSYPSSGTNFVHYTIQQLDIFAWRVAKHYEARLPVRQTSAEKPMVVAMLGPSNLEYLITMLALSKLGHTVLLLSTRIPQVAIESLINTTGASAIVADSRHLEIVGEVQKNISTLQLLNIAERNAFEFSIEAHGNTQMDGALDSSIETQNMAFIIHSSANYATSMDMKAFITLPLFHNHGICNMFRAIYCQKPIYLYNADLPLAQDHLLKIMREHKFEIFYGVPYALKLLAETEEGIALLRELKIVMYGGSACPDDLGNLLVDNGVNLVGHYGATKDLFEPHPTIPRAWKYICRIDDTIVLVNGEKFNPLAMEGSIRSNKNITEAVVFGAGRPYLGILIVPAQIWAGKSNEEILAAVWPVVQSANKSADAFARISKGMVRLLSPDCDYPRTDKGSVIRQAFCKKFQDQIDEAYDTEDVSAADLKQLDLPELQAFVRDLLETTLATDKTISDDTDFFLLGLDSLQAIQMRSEILKTVDTGGKKLGQNIVFEQPSIEKLSQFLLSLRIGQDAASKVSIENEMRDLIGKYAINSPNDARFSIVVTGVTGSLGAHVAAKLTADPRVDRIYCLVRAPGSAEAIERVKESMVQRQVYHAIPLHMRRKLVALPSDLSDAKLGLSDSDYESITQDLRVVIHCAWSVNFNMQLSSFAPSISGVANLISLCKSSASPASMNFCSSVSTCSRATTIPIPETVPNLEWAQGMGYAQSKSVAEHLCAKAATQGVTARVLRVGQIVGDTKHGVWNAQEAVPMMMQTAVTVGALPKLKETPSWLPVDTVAEAVADISLSDAGSVFTNVTNPKMFSWSDDLLPALRNAGLSFEEVEPKEWVQRLRTSDPDPTANPPIKLVDFFASKYDKEDFTPSKPFNTHVACSLSPALADAPVLDQDLVNKFVGYFLETSWKAGSTSKSTKTAILVAGPAGSGKSTVGTAVSQSFDVPFIEGDNLHSRSAVEKMRSNTALADEDRLLWLDRICNRAESSLFELGYDSVVISCSALKLAYRSKIRSTLAKLGVKVIIFDLQVGKEALVERLEQRKGHYMSAAMADGQLSLHENPGLDEADVLPIDAEAEVHEVVGEVKWFLSIM
ncbi:hypothetical protein G7Z17_g176 [Cylindrodendrum hubeiense]|uniref:gluconokinase n=1 Tax=Cylindrodendrum hubeiense TaxID=595255 RepID=A0A9P5HLU1_9HYPO|nr:hypothetical protein G7Z17_g176 [Cylindrodendrum hubeiense]